MPVSLACIAGEEIYRQWQGGLITGQKLGSRKTPFGDSGDIFLIEDDSGSYYLLCRHGQDMAKTAPYKINYQANMYALKDMEVESILAWGPGGAITHNMAVGDLVVLSDVIDQTHLRPQTFFENSPLGFLRQFPVFCPSLRRICGEVLHEMKLVYHGAGIAAVCEGPRLETPAEVRMLSTMGAELVTHAFVPEVFLAKELQMCYAAICYIVNYAETGSRHRPFGGGGLFGAFGDQSDGERASRSVTAMNRIVSAVAATLQSAQRSCRCSQSMAGYVKKFDLDDDWRKWIS